MNRTGKLDSGPEQTGAVILAGGRGSRLGGADKPGLVVGEHSLLATVVEAAGAAGARQVVVVGPPRPGLEFAAGELRVVREEPPGGGPVPALRRGLAEIATPWVLVLAADLPFLRGRHLRALPAAARAASAPGAVLADETGRPQWLAGGWHSETLRRALGGYAGSSLHGLLHPLRPAVLSPDPAQPGPAPWLDCDTEDDLRLARERSSNVASGRAELDSRGEVPS
ncbi:MAG TPA: NTP transferase domain-containing protein [Streptosporangiaceae bacterium]